MELAQDFFGKKIIEHFGAETAVLDITLKTDLGMRPAHPRQLRDTCAVWYIRQSALIQDVAKMLGDTIAMVERHYLPYIEELKDAHVATNKRILEAAGAD